MNRIPENRPENKEPAEGSRDTVEGTGPEPGDEGAAGRETDDPLRQKEPDATAAERD